MSPWQVLIVFGPALVAAGFLVSWRGRVVRRRRRRDRALRDLAASAADYQAAASRVSGTEADRIEAFLADALRQHPERPA